MSHAVRWFHVPGPPFCALSSARASFGADGRQLRALRVVAGAHGAERRVERPGDRYQVADSFERERAIVGHVPTWRQRRSGVNARGDLAGPAVVGERSTFASRRASE